MSKITSLIVTVTTLFSSLFGGSALANLPTAGISNGVVTLSNIHYGSGSQEYLDIAYPVGARGNVDVIIDVHGGAWYTGDKSEFGGRIKAIAQCGYVGVSVNYTYISETSHCDTILDEITQSLKTVQKKMKLRGITVKNYFIEGYSAGAHLAALYAYSRGAESGLKPVGVNTMSGPNALEYLYRDDMKVMLTENTLGDEEFVCLVISCLCGETVTTDNLKDSKVQAALQKVSPTHYVDTAVPTLIAQGKNDVVVPPANADILAQELTKAGVDNHIIWFPNSGHDLWDDSVHTSEIDERVLQMVSTTLSAYKK